MVKEVTILGHKYEVVEMGSPLLVPEKGKKKIWWGDINDKRIRFYNGSGILSMQIFFHEIFHAIFDQMGRAKLSRDEKFVDDLAIAFTDTLVLNPKLVDWIQDNVNKETK